MRNTADHAIWRSSQENGGPENGTLQRTQSEDQIPRMDDNSKRKILLTTLPGDRIEDSTFTDRRSALNRQIEFRGATSTASAKYC